MNKKLSVQDISFIAIFTALIIVLSQISISMPTGVAITLQTFIIPIAGIVLGEKKGTISSVIYIVIGLIGFPVFSSFSGGISAIISPTGGFILSFPFMAFIAGVGARENKSSHIYLGLCIGSIVNFLCGMLFFALITSADIKTSFFVSVLPYIPLSIVKVISAKIIGEKMKLALTKSKFNNF